MTHVGVQFLVEVVPRAAQGIDFRWTGLDLVTGQPCDACSAEQDAGGDGRLCDDHYRVRQDVFDNRRRMAIPTDRLRAGSEWWPADRLNPAELMKYRTRVTTIEDVVAKTGTYPHGWSAERVQHERERLAMNDEQDRQ